MLLNFTYDPRKIPQLTIKVDVSGYADPAGWPYYLLVGQLQERTDGLLDGAVRIWGLDTGAVRMRVRVLSEDMRDAIAEETIDGFLNPGIFAESLRIAHLWLQPYLFNGKLRKDV